jgi:hypothetical protein
MEQTAPARHPAGHDPVPLLTISSVFKDLFGRALSSPFRHLGVSRSQGRGDSNPVLGRVGGRSAAGASPL